MVMVEIFIPWQERGQNEKEAASMPLLSARFICCSRDI